MINENTMEVFIINYNGKNTVLSTIESLYNSKNVKVKITVLDDHSSDDSPNLIKQRYPEIPVNILPYNSKRANILRNKALEIAESEFVFISDNDLKYDENCLSNLLNYMKSDDSIATCTPRMMYWDQPDKIYIAGTKVHFIGAAISDHRDKIYNNNTEVSSNSGSGICLLRRSIVDIVGGFDLNLLQGWGSDGEFYQRLLRAGYKCLYIPSAFALHEEKLVVTNRKFRVIGQTYNRWVFIFTHYSLSLILLLIPAFMAYELLQFVFVIMKGIFPQYVKGNLLVIKKFSFILKKRRFVQSIKVVSDKDVLFSGNIYIAPALIEKHKIIKYGINAFIFILNIYWVIIKKILYLIAIFGGGEFYS